MKNLWRVVFFVADVVFTPIIPLAIAWRHRESGVGLLSFLFPLPVLYLRMFQKSIWTKRVDSMTSKSVSEIVRKWAALETLSLAPLFALEFCGLAWIEFGESYLRRISVVSYVLYVVIAGLARVLLHLAMRRTQRSALPVPELSGAADLWNQPTKNERSTKE